MGENWGNASPGGSVGENLPLDRVPSALRERQRRLAAALDAAPKAMEAVVQARLLHTSPVAPLRAANR